jgi:hypothetical protein
LCSSLCSTGTAGILHIRNVTGGSGEDMLIGDGADNLLLGNGGNDSLNGGDGNDLLLGGAGDDVLIGGNGRDLLLGGQGADALDGGAGDDVLMGGTTDHDANPAALDALMAEWSRTDLDYRSRIDHLPGRWPAGPTARSTSTRRRSTMTPQWTRSPAAWGGTGSWPGRGRRATRSSTGTTAWRSSPTSTTDRRAAPRLRGGADDRAQGRAAVAHGFLNAASSSWKSSRLRRLARCGSLSRRWGLA